MTNTIFALCLFAAAAVGFLVGYVMHPAPPPVDDRDTRMLDLIDEHRLTVVASSQGHGWGCGKGPGPYAVGDDPREAISAAAKALSL